MTDLLKLILGVLASLFRSRAKLEAEILILRQQINGLCHVGGACRRRPLAVSVNDDQDQLQRVSLPARDHLAGHLALRPFHLELPRCRGFAGRARKPRCMLAGTVTVTRWLGTDGHMALAYE